MTYTRILKDHIVNYLKIGQNHFSISKLRHVCCSFDCDAVEHARNKNYNDAAKQLHALARCAVMMNPTKREE